MLEVSRAVRRSLALPLLLLGCSVGTRDPELYREFVQQPVLMDGNIYGGALPNKTVVLTYDDGPDEHTLELAQYLNQQGIQATFFVNGRRFCKVWNGDVCAQPMDTRTCNDGQSQAPVASPIYYPESILDQLTALGHRIGNHTTDHCHLTGQDVPADFEFELKSTQDIVDRHVCDGLFLFRAPFGNWDAPAAQLARAVPGFDKLRGPVNWDVDGGDWECFQTGTSVEDCGDGYLGILEDRPGQKGIFLHHDRLEFNVGSDGPLKLAQYLVPRLKERGYAFSTLDELLDHNPQGPLACPQPQGGSGGAGGAGGSGGTGGTGGGAGAAGASGGGTGGAAIVPAQGGSSAGGGGGAGGTSGGSAGAAPAPLSGGSNAVPAAAPVAADSGSCAVAGRPTEAPRLAAFIALGACAALLRRRRSRALAASEG